MRYAGEFARFGERRSVPDKITPGNNFDSLLPRVPEVWSATCGFKDRGDRGGFGIDRAVPCVPRAPVVAAAIVYPFFMSQTPVAKVTHRMSSRAAGQFRPVNPGYWLEIRPLSL
jgi:hypothetical protein